MLKLSNTWFEGGHKFVRWTPTTASLLKHVKTVLYDSLAPYLSRRCSHIKGHGGVKLSVDYSQRLCNHFGYVARLDVRSYYSSMNHQIILDLLK
jgi:RNA-directed DNA polymerase